MSSVIHLATEEVVFENYLCRCPLAHAIFRTSEMLQLVDTTLARPVLDVGCGTGEFASCVLDSKVDAGIDISSSATKLAHQSNMYTSLNTGPADNLPYRTDLFQTAISISVFEHISCPIDVLREIRRVLRPGGELLATLTLSDFNQRLIGRSILLRISFGKTDFGYSKLMNWTFNHVTMRSVQYWEQTIREAGFENVELTRIVPSRVSAWWEVLLASAWPSKISRSLVWHPKWVRRLLWKVFSPVIYSSGSDGICLFIRAS